LIIQKGVMYMSALNINKDLLEKFEKGLDPRHPERSKIPAKIIGYGEISTIFEIQDLTQKGLAYKRLPIFKSRSEMDQYERIYNEYNRLLKDEVGIEVPDYGLVEIIPDEGNMVIYNVQSMLPPASIGNKLLHSLNDEDCVILFEAVLKELKKVWSFNKRATGVEIGIDGQISNWALKDFNESRPTVTPDSELLYFDTSTPLFRINAKEQINPDLFLRSAPSFLVWLIKWLFLEDVVTRYYDFHMVIVDLIANLYKEQRPDLIPRFIDRANTFISTEAKEFDVKPVDEKEVRSYYREDAIIWRLYLALRRLDRFLMTRLLHRPYVYILPGRIKR